MKDLLIAAFQTAIALWLSAIFVIGPFVLVLWLCGAISK